MHAIHQYLEKTGRKILRARVRRTVATTFLAAMVYLTLYFLGILIVKSMSLTWMGLLLVPGLLLAATLVAVPYQWWQFRDPRKVARYLEHRFPQLQLSLRTSLDFLAGRVDCDAPFFRNAYVDKVANRFDSLDVAEPSRYPWTRMAFIALAFNLALWSLFQQRLLDKYYNPSMSFGQTHLNLNEGSITVFEPEYTQIPGRTLPLKPGTFYAYPGSRIRFMIQLPPRAKALYMGQNEQEPVPLRIDEEQQATYELVLLENTQIQYFLAESKNSGRTEPYLFEVRTDEVPEIQLRSYTPEGILNTLDPLILEAEIKDDFGVQELHAVITWDGGEKRIPILVPPGRKRHFISKNQWFLSDFQLEDVDAFSIYLEAKDNNPINGPGIGKSPVLSYLLESPEKKYDLFMKTAKELLNTMTHTLGDNLETTFARTYQIDVMEHNEEMGKQIGSGLYRSLDLSNRLIGMVRETPNLSRMDQNFLMDFRNGVSKQARLRSEMGLLYTNIHFRRKPADYQRLVKSHNLEEVKVEDLTYELLLQLKMWAILDLERQKNQIDEDLSKLEELLNNSENMDQNELMEQFDKLMESLTKLFEQMMMQAAQEMDMTMQEFMNMDAMEMAGDQFEELRKQIMEALKNGDMEKAKELMEQLRAQMEASFTSMQQAMGEMSPEMQAMMKNMRELMGLLRELKSGEEELERDTQALKQSIDEEMGGNLPELDSLKQQQQQKATERIHELLTELYNKLVAYKTEDLSQGIVEQIGEYKERLDRDDLDPDEERDLKREIGLQERMLDFLSRDGLDQLQNLTLRNLEQTEKLQEYLDQNEYLLSLETGLKLESFLTQGERLSERTDSRELKQDARPEETFNEARHELYKILDALQNMKQNVEDRRRQFMQGKDEQRQQGLAQRQADLQRMIDEFMEKTEDSFGGSQVSDKLEDIGLSMRNAERKLQQAQMEGGVQYEQEALQKIGEMMEQLQQSQRPGRQRPFPMMVGRRGEGGWGDPSLEDIHIPESQKLVTQDQLKDTIRKRLEKNLPDAYGKEIRKYYEKLMDQ